MTVGCPRSVCSDLGNNESRVPCAPGLDSETWESMNVYSTERPGAPSKPRLLRLGWESTNLNRNPGAPGLDSETWESMNVYSTGMATLFASIALIPRIAWRVLSSFSMREKRTCPSP